MSLPLEIVHRERVIPSKPHNLSKSAAKSALTPETVEHNSSSIGPRLCVRTYVHVCSCALQAYAYGRRSRYRGELSMKHQPSLDSSLPGVPDGLGNIKWLPLSNPKSSSRSRKLAEIHVHYANRGLLFYAHSNTVITVFPAIYRWRETTSTPLLCCHA